MILKKFVAVAAIGTSMAFAAVASPGTASADVHGTNYVATISNGHWKFKVRLVEADDVAAAREVLAGRSSQLINGKIIRNGAVDYYNKPYTWHLDPADVQFVDMAMEVCDGSPADVENGTLTSDRYCRWGGRVIALDVVPI